MRLSIGVTRVGSRLGVDRLSASVLPSQRSLYHIEVGSAASSSHPLPPSFFCPGKVSREKRVPFSPQRTLAPRKTDSSPLSDIRTVHYSEQEPEPPTPQDAAHISDHEYQIRVGKACRVLVETLPDFMSRGVVDLDDLAPSPSGSPSPSSRPSLMRRLPFLNQGALKRAIWGTQAESNAPTKEQFDSLYHPSIAFEFRPPIPTIGLGKDSELSEQPIAEGAKPSSDLHRGGPTICFNGRTVYTTSAHILRHALSALFYDITLHLDSARFEGRSRTAWSDISSYLRRQSEAPDSESKTSSSGPDRLVIRLRFEGVSRVTLQPHTYTVIFKYDFDRRSGTIHRHVVDNIQPIPGSKVWAGLTNVWGTLNPAGAGRGGAAHYEGLALPEEIASPR